MGSGSGKTIFLFNLISLKFSNEAKYQLLFNKKKSLGLKHFNVSKAFIEHLNDMDDIYKTIEKYNPNKNTLVIDFI